MCPGVAPDVSLAESAGLRVGKGIAVDEHMRTSSENIFAAGDAVEALNAATGKNEPIPLWENAVEQGRIAGENMAGIGSTYAGGIWRNSLSMFGLCAVTLGQSHVAEKESDVRVLLSPGLKKGSGVRLVFSGKRLIGATLLGDTRNARHYGKLIVERFPAWDLREELLDESFNPLRLHLKFGPAQEDGKQGTKSSKAGRRDQATK